MRDIIAAMLFGGLTGIAATASTNDPDAERAPPEDVVISGKLSNLGSGYLWRMANRIHLAWAAQKPEPGDEDRWFDFEFHLYPDGSVSGLKFGDAKLDATGKKALAAFLQSVPFDAWSEATKKNLQDRTLLRVGIWLKARKPAREATFDARKEPNQAPEPTPGLRPVVAHL
jgi:hypothetical protein